MIKKIIFSAIFIFGFSSVLFASDLKPYKDSNEVIKDLKKSIDMALKVRDINKGDKKRYELLGKAVTLQGIMCRRSEISQFVIVQKAFEILRHKHGEVNSDYIAFTENCRSMFGLYR